MVGGVIVLSLLVPLVGIQKYTRVTGGLVWLGGVLSLLVPLVGIQKYTRVTGGGLKFLG